MAALGLGIIGTGWGARVQVPAFRAAGLETVALAGSDADKTRRVAESLGLPFATGDWRELIARDEVALVSIVTPPGLHREMAVAALAAGKHVLCEKPTAMNADEARAMHEAALARRDRFALIDHELRFWPLLLRMRELIRQGAIGTPRHARVTIANPSRMDPARPWNWWFDAGQGGGALGAIGSHAIDVLRFLIGEIEAASGYLRSFVAERTDAAGKVRPVSADDFVAFQLQLRGGVFANALVSTVVNPGLPNEFVLFGTQGTLTLHGETLQLSGEGGSETIAVPQHVAIPEGISGPFPVATVYLGHALRAALEHNTREPLLLGATFEDGLVIQRVLDAIRESQQRGGGWVQL